MSHINVVPEQGISHEHLSGEFHEITRVFTHVRKAVKSGKTSSCNLQTILKVISDARADIPECWWGDYEPPYKAIAINLERIRERS